MLVLMCEAAGQRFALDARKVVEVVPRVRLHSLASAPAWLAGVSIYRGHVTPILDLSYLVAAKACPNRWASRIILVRINDDASSLVCGLIVEKVTVAHLPAAPAQNGGAAGMAPWGPVLLDAEGMFQLLELPRLLTVDQRAAPG